MKVIVLLFALTCSIFAQEPLTNDSVLKMVKAGLGENLILSMIQGQPGKYSLTPDDLVKLKSQGVSEKLLGAMIAKGSGNSAPPSQIEPAPGPGPGPSNDSDLPQSMDVGVYYKKSGNWQEMLPEVVNWKTGGVLKSVASVGVIKGDVNGHLEGVVSHNEAVTPVELVVYAPEGVAITEYQLIHLHVEKSGREFRTVTGGVLHATSGATRDVIPFDGKKVASRTFRVSIPHLAAGEYGFLPPGATSSSNSASIGKLYTFHVTE